MEVLRGAMNLFGQTEVFIVETSLFPFFTGMPVLTDVLTFMTAHGYALYDFAGSARRPLDHALAILDAVFVRADGPFRASSNWA